MKVLYFSKGFTAPIPGPESVGRKLIDNLMKVTNEIEFFIVTDYPRSNDFEGRVFHYLHKNFPLPEFPILSFEWENCLSTRTLKTLCETLNPDLIHIQGRAGYYPSPPKDYPSLVTFHEFPPMLVHDDFSFGPSKFLVHLWLKRGQMIRMKRIREFTFFHALSSEIMRFLEESGIPHSRIFFIPNGTLELSGSKNKEIFRKIIRKMLGISDNSKIMTMVGSISHHKGVHFIKKCISDLPINYHLVLIGGFPKFVGYQYLRSILRGKSSHRIHYLGYQSSKVINAILNASDCYLSLSISEACQLSTLEAIDAGVPVIITDCGAARDIFGRNYNFLLPVSPSKKILRDSIIEATEDNFKLQNSNIRKINWREMAILMKEAYLSVINQTYF